MNVEPACKNPFLLTYFESMRTKSASVMIVATLDLLSNIFLSLLIVVDDRHLTFAATPNTISCLKAAESGGKIKLQSSE